jgi:hypothetical protein
MRKCFLVVAALAAMLSEYEVALAQPVASQPQIAIGDTWEFRSMPGGRNFSLKVIAISPEGVVRIKTETGAVQTYDRSMNILWNNDPRNPRVFARYPMKVGDQWTYNSALDEGFAVPAAEQKGTVKVLAYESITVPAGTFDCYRIGAETGLPVRLSRVIWTFWYCPAVKWIARQHIERHIYNFATDGWSASTQDDELIKFTPGK